MIQPFTIIEGMSSMKYSAWFVSDSKDELIDRKRYEVLVELDPWDKLVSYRCECQGFLYKKKCKHITEILQLLKQWGEIKEIPEIKDKE